MRKISETFNVEILILTGLIALKFILQYHVINPVYELHRDEYLHLDQGHHLAWGYTSVPPVTSWTSYIILFLGGSVFWVKFFPALWGALTIVAVWGIIKELKGGLFAQVLAATALIFSVILRVNILYQPNSLDILCWAMVYFSLVKYINTNSDKWLLRGALVFAFGFLNKYNIIFLAIGLVPAILMTSRRTIFQKGKLYLGVALAFLIVLPNLIWQLNNHLPVIHHMRELTDTQLVNVSRKGFLMEQVLFFLSASFILVAAFISFFTYPPFGKYRLLFFSYWFTLAVFMYFHAKGYYALGLYPMLIAFGSVYIEALLGNGWKMYLRPVLVIVIIGGFVPFLTVVFPILTPQEMQKKAQGFKDIHILRWEDGKDHLLPEDFADMLGWRELAHKVDSAYELCGNKDSTMVFCDNYGEAAAINYYSVHKKINAGSFNADYINWTRTDGPVKYIVAVKDGSDEDADLHRVRNIFESITFMDSVKNPYARECGTRIYLVKGPKMDFSKWMGNKMAQERAALN